MISFVVYAPVYTVSVPGGAGLDSAGGDTVVWKAGRGAAGINSGLAGEKAV